MLLINNKWQYTAWLSQLISVGRNDILEIDKMKICKKVFVGFFIAYQVVTSNCSLLRCNLMQFYACQVLVPVGSTLWLGLALLIFRTIFLPKNAIGDLPV
jgi:hypothetical protein